MEGLELRKALEEARELSGARLAKVHQVGDVLFLRLFSPPGALVLDPAGKAFHRTSLRPVAPREPPPFCRAVRSLEGQRLLSLEQAGFDRVIRLRFPGGDLVLDLRPRTGNVFLLLPAREPVALRPGEYVGTEFGDKGDPLVGLGPALRKAARAVLGGEPPEEGLRSFARELAETPPRGFLYRGPRGNVASFFPRPELGEPLGVYSRFWQALDQLLEERLSIASARRYLEAVERALRRRQRALLSLSRELEEAARWEELQRKADLILARLSDIPKGKSEVEVEDFDGTPVKLSLDPAEPPLKQAQRLYGRAKKLRRKLAAIPARIEELTSEVNRLEELGELIRERPQLAPYLEGELAALGALPPPAPRRGREERSRARELEIGGFKVWVGRSARENDALVRRASPHDLWLHARGVPGAHVLIRTGGREVPEEVLTRAAELAAWYSKARGERRVEVSYTEARNLRKPKGAPPGLVRLLSERVIVVSGEEGP